MTDATTRLDHHVRRIATRVRRRRLVVVAWTTGIALTTLGGVVATWATVAGALGITASPDDVLSPARGPFVVALLLAGAVAWTRRVSPQSVARDIDRLLGLPDTAASAVAVRRGEVAGALGAAVVAGAVGTLDAREPDLRRAFPALPSRGARVLLGTVTLLIAAWVVAILLSAILGSRGGDGFRLPGWSGGPSPDVRGDESSARGAHDTASTDAGADPAVAGDRPDAIDPPTPDVGPNPEEPREEPPEDDAPPAPVEPSATASIVPTSSEYDVGDATLVLGFARPASGLSLPTQFRVSVELDGREFPSGATVALDPASPRQAVIPLHLGRMGLPPDALAPGTHSVRLVLRPDEAGRTDPSGPGGEARSPPADFDVRGAQSPQTSPTGPQRQPPPAQSPPAQPPPPPGAPEGAPDPPPGGEPESPEATGPPPEFERKVVVPLISDDDAGTVRKKDGPRLVLVPGGGPEAEPRLVDVAGAAHEAQRRAESAVDAADVRVADRPLVRRYFERLRDALRLPDARGVPDARGEGTE